MVKIDLLMGSEQLTMGSEQMTMGSGQMTMGSEQMTAGSGQMTMGSGQLTMGSEQMTAGSGQMTMGSDIFACPLFLAFVSVEAGESLRQKNMVVENEKNLDFATFLFYIYIPV